MHWVPSRSQPASQQASQHCWLDHASFCCCCCCTIIIILLFSRSLPQAMHPVLSKISHSVANSIFINDDLNFHIITGPNMSGKTTFLKQTAILQIMAQIGSCVPATSATFTICERLFTRMGLNDSLQANTSSFMMEMKELNYILNVIKVCNNFSLPFPPSCSLSVYSL